MTTFATFAWLVVLGLWLSGCANAPGEPDRTRATVADILGGPLEDHEYVAPRRCFPQISLRNFEPLGDRYLVFEGPGGRLWLNELRGRCPALQRGVALAFRNRGGAQVCELDQFKVTDWFSWSSDRRAAWQRMDGIPCTLGGFQELSPQQLAALRAALP